MKFFYLFFFFFALTSLNAQDGSSFGFEVTPQLFLVNLPESNTEASTRTSYGFTVAGVAEVNLNPGFRLETGVQFGYSFFSQRVIERNTLVMAPDNVVRSLAADAAYFHAGIPLFLKYSPLGDTGPYLKAGARGQFNFGDKTSARLTDADGSVPEDPIAFPGGEVDVPDFSLVPEIGLGYRFYGRDGRAAYLEISYARIPGNALGYSGPRDAAGRSNLLDTAQAGSINVTFGSRFGR